MSKFYMKSDGNGGMMIGKGTMAIVLFLISIFSTFAAVVAYSVTVKAEVAQQRKEIDGLEGKMTMHETDTSDVGKQLATITVKLDQTQKDIEELKKDTKSLLYLTTRGG